MTVFAEGATADQKIMEWNKTQTEMKRLTTLERLMRDEVVATVFPDAKKGTNNFELGAGWKLKAVTGVETKLDANMFAMISSKLKPETIESCIKYTPDLIAAGYKALSQEELDILNEAITTKPKAVQLTLVPPKEA